MAVGMDRDMQAWIGSEEVRQRALEGARLCVEHWVAEDDGDMVADALARLHRIEDGTALVLDIEGALDWLD